MGRLKNLPEIMRMNWRVRCAAQGCIGLKPTCPRFLIPPVVRTRVLWGIVSVLGENKYIFQSYPFKSKMKEDLSDTRDETVCF